MFCVHDDYLEALWRAQTITAPQDSFTENLEKLHFCF
jgi:hypothetical protein